MRRLVSTLIESGPSATWVAIQAKRRGAKQKLREFAGLCKLVRHLEPRVVVEIGTMRGGSLWAWCQLASPDALLVSIDLPGGPFGGEYSATGLESHARLGQRLCFIRADSHDPTTADELKRLLDGRTIDLLFIDGDHSYEGVTRDYELYSPLVAARGLVVFHDILPCRPEDGNVNRLWEELKSQGRWHEIADTSDVSSRGHWGGIGVLTR
jgi:cephalosporin hydroxylase